MKNTRSEIPLGNATLNERIKATEGLRLWFHHSSSFIRSRSTRSWNSDGNVGDAALLTR